MKYHILFFLILPFNLIAQTYGTGRELIPISNVKFSSFENKIIPKSVPSSTDTPLDILQHTLFGTNGNILSDIYTDIDSNRIQRKQYIYNTTTKKAISEGAEFKLMYAVEVTTKNDIVLRYTKVSIYKDLNYQYSTFFVLIKEKGKWQVLGKKKKKNLEVIPLLESLSKVRYVKSKIFYHLMTGEKTGDSRVDAIIKKTRFNDAFDINRMYLLMLKWMDEDNDTMYDYFFDKR